MPLATRPGQRLDRLFIDGEWVEPLEGGVEDVINPATEEAFAQAPVGTLADSELAIAAARRAMDEGPWPTMPRRERSRRLFAFHDYLLEHAEEIGELVRQEAGAIKVASLHHHVLGPLKLLEFCAEVAARDFTKPLPPIVSPAPGGGNTLGSSIGLREPAGVIAAITAFNFPFYLNVQKLGPALAMGNAVILKPSPFTPLVALVMAEAAEAADLPPGVLNIVTGGPDTGAQLTNDPRVDLVSFTGSDEVGVKIMQQAATTLKRVLLELGGKSALIVRADADLDAAAIAGFVETTRQAGQGCISCMRHLVHNSVREEYVARVADMLATVKVGDTADPETTMGPLIRESQRSRVERYVALGLEEDAKLVTGGKRPESCTRGFFYEPTLFTDVRNSAAIAQDEIFGPVAAVVGFDDDDEAVRLANDSRYGLSGQIWSRDVGTAYLMAQGIRTGQVLLNGGNMGASPWDPFGGIKRSGIGRENGEEGLLEYTEVKTIRFHGG